MELATRIVSALLLALCLAFPAQAADDGNAFATAEDARLAGDEQRTRFVVDLDRHLDFRVFSLADPYRVVIDLPETDFAFPDDPGKDGRGLVTAYRYGLFAPGKSRIVLDTEGPVKVDKAFALEPQDGQPARLVLDLVSTDRESMLAEVALSESRNSRRRSAPGPDDGVDAVPPGEAKNADGEVVVVIDPGHGGIDSGAVSRSGTREKDVVLAFSERLRELLQDTGRYEIHMTRDKDIFIPLADRVNFGREKGASLFISIHADSVAQKGVSGATVYTLSERASDALAAQLAERENRSDAIAGVELSIEADGVADILLDLVRRETKNYSVFFARTLVDKLSGSVDMVKNPHRYAGFRVLKAHDVPSVLVELGYLTNSSDEKRLTDEEWQDGVAERIVESVNTYFGSRQAHRAY